MVYLFALLFKLTLGYRLWGEAQQKAVVSEDLFQAVMSDCPLHHGDLMEVQLTETGT